MCAHVLSGVPALCDPWIVAGSSVHGILRQECQNRLPFPPPGDLPTQGSNAVCLTGGAAKEALSSKQR